MDGMYWQLISYNVGARSRHDFHAATGTDLRPASVIDIAVSFRYDFNGS